jgi:serine/threonine protein kinase
LSRLASDAASVSECSSRDDELHRALDAHESRLCDAVSTRRAIGAPRRYNPPHFFSSMGLVPGDRIGPFEVLSSLGGGGMGEVYRAHDTKLHRDVALKVVPAALSHDPDRLARFEREATVLAALNHPNIAAVYGVAESVNAIVMEFVEGDTLADRIARGPLAVGEPKSFGAVAD